MFFSHTIKPTKKKRRSTKAHQLTFERFEPRHLMTADGIVASYASDFGSQGWSYSYNAGGQELQSNGGNLTALTNVNGNYRVANADPSNRFLFLNQVGGHPGTPRSDAAGNTVDQYAVVTWEVPESGYYEIADSRLEVPNGSGDGVEFSVYVNDDAPVTTGIASPSRISYFDSRLGFLSKGDSVRVAFGAGGSGSFDYFETDFNFVRNNQLLQTVGGFEDAFAPQSLNASSSEPTDWRLLWNAPDNWRPVGPISALNLTTGGIDQPENFRPLFRAAGGPVFTADANLQPTGDPDGFLNFSAAPVSHPDLPDTPLFSGHPGAGYGSSSVFEDRFAIVEFTVSQSGFYAINNSQFSLDERSSGVEVVVGTSVDPASFRTNITSSGLVQSEFDVSLGALSQGDKIYVAFGAGGFHNSDSFATNFDVVRVLPRELPLRQLPAPQVTFHASDIEGLQTNDRGNDYAGLRALFDQAAALAAVSEDDAPVRVVLQPGVYNISAPDGFDEHSLFSFTNVSGLEIEGNGAELFVESPLLGVFTVTGSSDVILQNFQVDYVERYIYSDQSPDQDVYRATTTSQARVIGSPDFSNNSIVVRFDPNVTVAPDRQFFSEAASPQVFASLLDPNVAGRTKFDTDHFIEINRNLSGQQLSATDYRIVFEDPRHLQQVAANDRIAFQRRENTAIFSFFADKSDADSTAAPVFNGSHDVTVNNVTAWSSPGTFISSIGTERLNVLNSRVSIRAGRWRSISADALHIQSSREGAWVENSDFAGGADDVSNFYTLPLAINQRLLNPRELAVTAVTNQGTLDLNRDLYQEGDRLQFFDPVKGEVFQEARIANVGQAFERDGVTMLRLTFDQPIDAAARAYIESDVERFGNDTQIFNRDLSKNFLVQGSQFRNTRRYGTFLMSENVQIVDSLYSGLSDAAIAGHNEASWPLGNLPSDVLIQNNRFNSIGFSREYLSQDYARGVISFQIDSSQLNREFGRQVVDRLTTGVSNLTIRDNTFRLWGKAAISVRNAQNVTIEGNQIYFYGVDGENTPLSPIEVSYSSDVQVSGTSFLNSNRTDIDNFFATEGNGEGIDLETPGFI